MRFDGKALATYKQNGTGTLFFPYYYGRVVSGNGKVPGRPYEGVFMLIKRLVCAALLLLVAACGTTYVPGITSMTKVDPEAVNNGQKSLVVMRVSTPWGTPAETHWLHVESGELVKITSQFAASSQEKAREFDMVTLPAGYYVLTYVMYSDSTKGTWPSDPFSLDPSLAEVSRLGQVKLTESGGATISALRSKGLSTDGKTPLVAGFTITPGKVAYLGEMVIEFRIQGEKQLPGLYPAGRVAWRVDNSGFERAKLNLAKESPSLAEQMTRRSLTRGSQAKNL